MHHCNGYKEKSPKGLSIRTLGLQLIALFGKAAEPLEGWALLKEVCHWGRTLRFYKPASLPVLSFSASLARIRCDLSVSCLLGQPHPLAGLPPMPWQTLSLWNCKPKWIFPKLLLVRVIYHWQKNNRYNYMPILCSCCCFIFLRENN